MNFSCSALAAQYELCAAKEGKVYFAFKSDDPLFTNESRISRFFHSVFWGYSFDLTENAKKLAQKVSIFSEVPTEETIRSRLKILGILDRMLAHAIETRSSRENPSPSDLQTRKTIFKKITSIAQEIENVPNLGMSKERLLLQCGCTENVYNLLKEETIPSDISASDLQPILQMACSRQDYDLAYKLLQNNVPLSDIQAPESFFLELSRHVLEALDDTTLTVLIKSRNEVKSSKELYLEAAKFGLFDSIRAFVEGGAIDPCCVSQQKNTALHFAFMSGNISLIQYLFSHIDPTTKNKHNQTALQLFIDTATQENQIPDADVPFFLETLLQRSPEVFQGVILSKNFFCKIRDKKQSVHADCIELSFLLNQPLDTFAPHIKREDFDASYDLLLKKYPKGPVKAFYLNTFALDISHLKTGCLQYDIPSEAPANVPLEALEQIFNDIDWKNDGAKLYEVVFERSPEYFANIKQELLDQLHLLKRRIVSKEVFLGTPNEGAALEDFYSKIERALRYSAAKLLEVKNPKLTLEFMKEILTAARFCGGRYFQTAINQYLLICKEIIETPRGYFERMLADYRRICFEGVVGELNHGYVHALTQASADLGEELGIPGTKILFEDIYVSEEYNKRDTRRIFFKQAYTPYSIVFEHLFPLFSQDSEASSKYIDLQKEIMPQDWNDEKYRPLYEELSAIPENLSKKDREKEEESLLEKHSIMRANNQTIQKAIEEDRRGDYLENFVYDKDGKRTLTGLIYALERLGVIQSSLKYNDPSKKVIPIPQESPYRAISLSALFSSIGTFFKGLFSWS